MVIAADYPFLEIVGTMIVFFAWVAWFWILISILSDVFRRHDISGWGKAALDPVRDRGPVPRRARLPGRPGQAHG